MRVLPVRLAQCYCANFQVNHVFDLPVKPGLLYFLGKAKSGTITERMKVDLTFTQVALKAPIETVVSLEPVWEN